MLSGITIFSGIIFVIAIIGGIGPQNLNTINHAIRNNYPYVVAITCVLSDSLLILLSGIGISLSNPKIILGINIIGMVFILYFVSYKIIKLFQTHSRFKVECNLLTRKRSILQALELTWFNPLVFIDTLVIIGGTAARYTGLQRANFIIGAIVGDFIWIFGLVVVARLFANKLNRVIVWIVLDIATIVVMGIILYKTINFVLQ